MRKGWETWDCAIWRRLRGISSVYINTSREGAKRTELGSFQWCPVTGPEIMSASWKTGSYLWTSEKPFSLWEWRSTGTGCPGRLWSLHPWWCSKAAAHGPGQHAWGGLSRGIGAGDLQRSLPTSTMLWFYDLWSFGDTVSLHQHLLLAEMFPFAADLW